MTFFSCSLCQGFAATCACGTPWTFLFTVLARKAEVKKTKKVNTDITVYYNELVVNLAFQYSGDISKGASPDGKVDGRKISSLE